ncbi:hypothetical protein BDY21DRAFT_345756 [Lineolata rhizophorae]|uniref:Uncharacterized protein n=1 Tax=Lineolata rhizophorae TaxID=578093 RepID=A0A6A6NYS6_9PEZI|nr:hypothetical protein BDY21DRAFT_345756 [Lineolata rhizophorae]
MGLALPRDPIPASLGPPPLLGAAACPRCHETRRSLCIPENATSLGRYECSATKDERKKLRPPGMARLRDGKPRAATSRRALFSTRRLAERPRGTARQRQL